MTNGDRIRSWDDLTLARWFALTEKMAIKNENVIKAMSEDALIRDWMELLVEKENDYGKTYNS
jgi:hypothetical protein